MSHSSAEVTYQPAGAGQRARTAQFDTSIISDPKSWLAKRLGPLVRCDVTLRSDDLDAVDGEIKGGASSSSRIDDHKSETPGAHAMPEDPSLRSIAPGAPLSSGTGETIDGRPHLNPLRTDPSNAPNKNPAADEQASSLLHARDVPHRPPTQDISL
jgi:hypothetical protein